MFYLCVFMFVCGLCPVVLRLTPGSELRDYSWLYALGSFMALGSEITHGSVQRSVEPIQVKYWYACLT